jgi:hypothetical protein
VPQETIATTTGGSVLPGDGNSFTTGSAFWEKDKIKSTQAALSWEKTKQEFSTKKFYSKWATTNMTYGAWYLD